MDPPPQDDSLNLDSLSTLELGRVPATQDEPHAMPPEPVLELAGAQRRRHPDDRELLRQPFDRDAGSE